MDDIKSQLTLLTQALTFIEKGKLPAQPQPNPFRHVQAITVLRSGKAIDKTILPSDPKGRREASKVAEGSVERKSEPSEKREREFLIRTTPTT